MQLKSFQNAGIKRVLIETFAPFLLLYVLMLLWQVRTFYELVWMYILTFVPEFWMSVWPAYRFKKVENAKESLALWAKFLIPYLTGVFCFEWIMEWLLKRLPVFKEYPVLLPDNQEVYTDYVWILAIALFILVAFRLIFFLLGAIWEWASGRLVRQITLSHVNLFLFLVFSLVSSLVFYTVTTYIPKVVRGENETVQVARWASYMMENPRLQSSLPEWIRQVESTAWNEWIFRWSPYQVERYWTIYNRKGELVADSTYPFLKEALISQAAHHEEKAFIREVLKTQKLISIPLKSGSRYMTAAPVYGHDGRILGVVNQMIRFDDFFYVDAVVLTMFFSFLLSIPLILLTVLLAFVIALPFSYLHARFVTRRIVQVGEAAKAWSRGELAFRIRDEQIDELGILSRQLNQLAGSLEETTHKLHNEKRQVESLLKSKQEFVANVSHELRNPLAIIQGYVEQLHMQDPWKKTKEVRILKREVTRLQKMIDDLFVIATEDEKKSLASFLQPEKTQVDGLIKQSHETFSRIAWQSKKVSILLEIEPELPLVRVDRKRLSQMLDNLIRNALRFTPSGSMIKLSARSAGNHCVIEVQDTGMGISEDELPYIFERYYQGKTGGREHGAGLGLALVKEWVEAMGGKIEVESKANHGTLFRLCFPAIDSE
jgi:signal transduction histidine kinase